ncbi:MAG: cytochrome b/b6 domain-containing protein [Gammaproteobacteria bacterium]|nr:cytochrome b/b6 domain-containing protein [Gammaproteobacteria bacterium]MDE2070998.1 cytochrome b/b6 domain-containing protein [Gammaproteobacteria bacterium]
MPDLQMPAPQWSRPLRLIHLLLAAAVTAQLFIGSFMRSPHRGRPDTFGFETHEVLGATILTLIIVHWLWSFSHQHEGLRQLFPWTRAGMHNVVAELWTGIRHQRLPPGGPRNEDGGLAGFVHGLGLLAITAMAATGASYYLSRMAGASHDSLELIEDIHDTFAVIAWIYWGGHLGATVLHSLLRQPVWRRMFSLKS